MSKKKLVRKAKRRYSDLGAISSSPSKNLKTVFLKIVDWVREQGCEVNLNWGRKTVYGSNGYFTPDPKPHISMGLKSRTMKNAIVLLLHEFCHYWQWKEDFLNKIDDDGNNIYAKILEGKVVAPKERDRARKLVAVSEYDCEKRTAFLLKKWNLTSNVRTVSDHIKAANAYNRHAAWSIGTSTSPGSGKFFPGHESLADKLWPGKTNHKWFTAEQSVSPISKYHKEVFDTAMSRYRKNKNKN